MFFRARCLVSRTIFRARLRARYLVSRTMSHFAHDVALRARYLVSRTTFRARCLVSRTTFRARCLVSRTIWLFAQGVSLRARCGSSRKVSCFAQGIPRKTSRKMPRFAQGIPRKIFRARLRARCLVSRTRLSDLAQVLPLLAAAVFLPRCCQNWRPFPSGSEREIQISDRTQAIAAEP